MEETKSAVVAVWALISQAAIHKFCQGFQTPLQLCLAKGTESTSNDFW
jgi:hypothetical protein